MKFLQGEKSREKRSDVMSMQTGSRTEKQEPAELQVYRLLRVAFYLGWGISACLFVMAALSLGNVRYEVAMLRAIGAMVIFGFLLAWLPSPAKIEVLIDMRGED